MRKIKFTEDLEDEAIDWIGSGVDKEKMKIYFKTLIQNYSIPN